MKCALWRRTSVGGPTASKALLRPALGPPARLPSVATVVLLVQAWLGWAAGALCAGAVARDPQGRDSVDC